MGFGGPFPVQYRLNFVITHLMEIAVELADREEIVGGFEANNFVSVATQRLKAFRRRDRHCQHQPLGFLPAYTAKRGPDRGTCRDSIVNHNYRLARERDLRPTAATR